MRGIICKEAKTILRGLSRNGYAVDVVEDGREALEAMDVNRYDLFILDLDSSDTDGLEICRIARKIVIQGGFLVDRAN